VILPVKTPAGIWGVAMARKNETVTFRMDTATLETIQRAAHMAGKSVTSFVTDAAFVAAQKELLDQRFVAVGSDMFDHVEALLAEPAKADAALEKLFRSNLDWID
jgi:uncharacterized protein (DUF1778 family)